MEESRRKKRLTKRESNEEEKILDLSQIIKRSYMGSWNPPIGEWHTPGISKKNLNVHSRHYNIKKGLQLEYNNNNNNNNNNNQT